MSQSDRTPEFDEPTDPTERATQVVEEQGLPEDNPFTTVVSELREDGVSWRGIFDEMDDVFSVIDKAAFEEGMDLLPDWRVTVIKPSARATSGKVYEVHTITAETAEEAEERAREQTGHPVDTSKTEQAGTSKLG
jgi:hypothetical protein